MRARDAALRASLLAALALAAAGTSRRLEDRRDDAPDGVRVVFEIHSEVVAGSTPPPAADLPIVLRRHVPGALEETSTRHAVPPSGATVDLSAGPPCTLTASCDDAVVWPRQVPARNGRTIRLRVEPLAVALLRCGGPQTEQALRRLDFTADRYAAPTGPPERVEALQVAVDLALPYAAPAAGGVAVRVPRGTEWWCLGEIGDVPFLTRFRADDPVAWIAPCPPVRLAEEPRVAGRPVPPGTLLAPGRLDLCAAAWVHDAVVRRGWHGAVLRGTQPWSGAEIPSVDCLTLAHPSFGLAYARNPAEPIDARPEPCEIRFEATHGGRFTATVAVWPAWPGADASFSRPFDAGLRRWADGVQSLSFRGLPPGAYRFDYRAGMGRSPPGVELRRGSRRLAATSPREVVVVATGPE